MNDTCCQNEQQPEQAKRAKNNFESTLRIPEPMQPAPRWSGVAVKDSQIVNISIDDYAGKYLVFIFYPYDFAVVCPMELVEFSDRVNEFRALNSEVVMISTDSEFAHLAWSTTPRKQGGLAEIRVPMLSDKNHKISRDYGVLDEDAGTAHRALFVVDDKKILRHATINDVAIPRSVDEVLRVIEACKFVDKHGNICPMGPKRDVQSFPSNESVMGRTNDQSADYFSPI